MARKRVLSSVSLRHRHNVAVGDRTVRVRCACGGRGCVLGLVSAPKRMSFSCRISHSVTTYRNTLLIISTARKMRTRAVSGLCVTVRRSLRVVPVVGGYSVVGTVPRRIRSRVVSLLKYGHRRVVHTSKEANRNISRVLGTMIRHVPRPRNSRRTPLRTLVFSSIFGSFHNVVTCFGVIGKDVGSNSGITFVGANGRCATSRVNILGVRVSPHGRLRYNSINCVMSNVGATARMGINSAVARITHPYARTVSKFRRIGPVIFTNLCPVRARSFRGLHTSLRGLRLGSTSLAFRPRSSITLKFNFHYKFLKLLRVRVMRRHLSHRFGVSIVAAIPGISCLICSGRNRMGRIRGPTNVPSIALVSRVRRPCVGSSVVAASAFVKPVVALYLKGENRLLGRRCVDNGHIRLRCGVPLKRVIVSFCSGLGDVSGKCTSFSCRRSKFHPSGLIGLSVLLGKRPISTLSALARVSGTASFKQEVYRGLGRLLPHRRFSVTVRTTVNTGVVTHRAIGRLHGSMATGYCKNSIDQGEGLLRGRGGKGGHVGRVNGIRIPRGTFLTILGLSWPRLAPGTVSLEHSITHRVTHVCYHLSPTNVRTLSRVLMPFGFTGKSIILPRNRVYQRVCFIRHNVMERCCCGNKGRLARRFSCRKHVIVYVRDFLGRRPSHLVMRALRGDHLCNVPCSRLRRLTRRGHRVRLLFHGVVRRTLVDSRIRTSDRHFRGTARHCAHLLGAGPRVLLHTPVLRVTSCLRVSPRALDHIHDTRLTRRAGGSGI